MAAAVTELGQLLKLWWGIWSTDSVGAGQDPANNMATANTMDYYHGRNPQVGRGQGSSGVGGKMEVKAVEREVGFGVMGVECQCRNALSVIVSF